MLELKYNSLWNEEHDCKYIKIIKTDVQSENYQTFQ